MNKTIVLSGFWGRGNCGDEAILQCQYEFFTKHGFEVRVIVDEYGAYCGFHEWYPYNDVLPIIHTGSLGEIFKLQQNRNIVALHVGGGGLEFGFMANFALIAKYHNIPVILSGVDVWDESTRSRQVAMQQYLDLFSFTADRYFDWNVREGLLNCRPIQKGMVSGSDWAFDLISDEWQGIDFVSDRVLVIVREMAYESVTEELLNFLISDLQAMSLLGLKVCLLPFCVEDKRFLEYFNLTDLAPMVELWSNPRRMQQYVANSAAVLSYGRLHPIIFAANVNTPVAFVDMNFRLKTNIINNKLITMAKMLKVAILNNQEELFSWLNQPCTADIKQVQLAKLRLQEMQDKILALLCAN